MSYSATNKNNTLIKLERVLAANDKSLASFPTILQPDSSHYIPIYSKNPLIEEELDYCTVDQSKILSELTTIMTTEQREAYNKIIAAAENPKALNHVFFIDGAAGTGKTFLYKAILAYMRANKKVVVPVASSGIAATLLPGGQTAHSRF
eukprot:TRINITY_DN1680_c0_g1_i1.p4 TRINITY_DN1680_c0_g1~~TRINITY_DN1680_c0_g1_i1.p4  ORF type:complete len:149 (-),score=15.04 TRINITY_DN1680_c0_g1_i1:1119-1565(-)